MLRSSLFAISRSPIALSLQVAGFVLSALVFTGVWSGRARAITMPSGFVAESLTPGQSFNIPTGFARTPDGRILVTEKPGRLMVYQNGVKLSTPMWDGQVEVLSNGDRGLVGIAVDPNYAVNRYIYLAYVVDPDSNNADDDWVAYSRLTRYRTSLANPNVLDLSTRTILIGKDWADGIPSGGDSHTIDCLRFAPDGSLLVSAGDGASYNVLDPGELHGPIFFPGRVDPLQDIGAFRSQYLSSLNGKVLRINPATGNGYVGNPYYDGQLNSIPSRVWSYGLRNPFRISIRPGTGSADTAAASPGTLYMSETGWSNWEELNVARLPGQNFGWPCYEGVLAHAGYQNATPAHHGCATIGTPSNPALATSPTLSWNHYDAGISLPPGYRGNSSTGNAFYSGSLYPATYQGCVFFSDMATDWLKVARMDATDHLVELLDFGDQMGGVVDLMSDPPTGDLLYISIYTGQIRRIRYTPAGVANQPPVAVASAGPLVGVAPATINFSSAGSSDPNGDSPLGFGWVFGDGQSDVGATTSHLYTMPGVYNVVLAASDPSGAVGRDTVQVIVNPTDAFPVTAVRDNFNRPDGTIGPNWSGQTTGFSLYASTLQWTNSGGRIRWAPLNDGPDQEAFVTLYDIEAGAGYELLLKLQGTTTTDAGVHAHYDPTAGTVTVSTFVGAGQQSAGAPIAVTYQAGDQFGARCYQNGAVAIYRNGALVGLRAVTGWPYYASGGGIGLSLSGGLAPHVDDFGGGSVITDSNTPPAITILTPIDSTFFAVGDTLHLTASFSDAQNPPDSLQVTWDVDLRHNNHTHPSIYHAATATANFIAADHDDGTGVHYIVRAQVVDRGGLAASRRADVFPAIDMAPSTPAVTPASPTQTDSLHWTFRIYNPGRMPAPTSHWILASDGVPFAEGDVQVARQDSVTLIRHIPPFLTPGDHAITLTVDALQAIYELNEANNVASRVLHIDDGASGLSDGPLARLGLSAAYPNPGSSEVFWLLSLPQPGQVEVRVFDIQGREVWGAGTREYAAGRWRLSWPGHTNGGASLPSGVYMARIVTRGGTGAGSSPASHSWTQRLIRIR